MRYCTQRPMVYSLISTSVRMQERSFWDRLGFGHNLKYSESCTHCPSIQSPIQTLGSIWRECCPGSPVWFPK
ncbi:hypothetical protein VTN02DRAFT_5824 [Thermoascus thermophilus]